VTPSVHGALLALGATPLDTVHGTFVAHAFHNLATGDPVLAVALGDVATPAPLLARLHSSCITSEVYGGCDCDCVEQLDAALAHVAEAGRGVVFYLAQEGRGAGLMAKARDRMLVQASRNRLTTFEAYREMGLDKDHRRYDEVGWACRLLGITAPLRLLTDNPDKVATLAAAGIPVDGTCGLAPRPSPFNRHYLAAKARAGHTFTAEIDHRGAADLPEPVEYAAPTAVPGAARFVRIASYLLPIRLSPPAWFRLHAYADLRVGDERIVLTHGRPGGGDTVLLRLQPETLLERFPMRAPRLKPRWFAAARRIVDEGVGCALFLRSPDEEIDGDLRRLLASHVPSGRARSLVDGPTPEAVAIGESFALDGAP
jgi:GTP cyclohydrolase II